MKGEPSFRSSTWTGMIMAFFGVPLIILVFEWMIRGRAYDNLTLALRELLIISFTCWFLWRIKRVEGKPLTSIGLHGRGWMQSILWALLIALLGLGLVFALISLLQQVGISFGDGKEAARFASIHPVVILLMVIRAGFAEEVFYRGYLMERLHGLNRNWLVYFLLPLVVFALWHFRQGIGGIVISFFAGALLAFFYWRRRDLKSNIIGHFLVDFIPNLVLPLFASPA